MNAIYTTVCGMFRVVEGNGMLFPQQRIVSVAGFGRLLNEQEVKSFENSPINKIVVGAWTSFSGGYEQFGTYKGDKSYKSDKAAIKFVNRCSEDLQGV
jgi:hypothetical protein